MSTETAIPSSSGVKAPSRGTPNWRIAGGAICKGREVDKTYEETPILVGRLVRVGIHTGVTDEGEAYTKFECELDTAEGRVSCGTSDTQKIATISFVEGLIACAKNELISISASQAAKVNKYGKRTTYAVVGRVNPTTLVSTQVSERILTREVSIDDAFEIATAKLKAHPAWAPRAVREDQEEQGQAQGSAPAQQDDSKLVLLQRELQMAGCHWPLFDAAEEGYLEMAGTIDKCTYLLADDVPDKTWVTILKGLRASVNSKAPVPQLLQKFVVADTGNAFA